MSKLVLPWGCVLQDKVFIFNTLVRMQQTLLEKLLDAWEKQRQMLREMEMLGLPWLMVEKKIKRPRKVVMLK